VTRGALSALLNERSHLSSEMAPRIEKAFGVSMDILMRMQNSVDSAQAASAKARSKSPPSRVSHSIRRRLWFRARGGATAARPNLALRQAQGEVRVEFF
jgi:plasmid maintenance system antidote protein VapI